MYLPPMTSVHSPVNNNDNNLSSRATSCSAGSGGASLDTPSDSLHRQDRRVLRFFSSLRAFFLFHYGRAARPILCMWSKMSTEFGCCVWFKMSCEVGESMMEYSKRVASRQQKSNHLDVDCSRRDPTRSQGSPSPSVAKEARAPQTRHNFGDHGGLPITVSLTTAIKCVALGLTGPPSAPRRHGEAHGRGPAGLLQIEDRGPGN